MDGNNDRAGVALAPDVMRDVDAFCRQQYSRLVGMLGLYCADVPLAEDLAQEALVRLVRNWSRLPSDADAQRWVTRVAFYLAKSSLRLRATRQRVLSQHAAHLAPDHASGEHATAIAVRAAVASLPERERRVIILRFFTDVSVSEAAELMGCPEGTVKSLTHSAIRRLRYAGLEVDHD